MHFVHIKKFSLRAAVLASWSITASMLGCQIGGFAASYDIQGVSPSDVNKTFFVKTKTKTSIFFSRPRPRPRLFI